MIVVDAGDDLITPVYVPPTRPPVQVTTKDKPCDDEEDCFTGSGSGEVTSTPDEHGTTNKGIYFSVQFWIFKIKFLTKL